MNENLDVLIQVVDDDAAAKANDPSSPKHSDCCLVQEGLSDQPVAEFEGIALQRAELTRSN